MMNSEVQGLGQVRTTINRIMIKTHPWVLNFFYSPQPETGMVPGPGTLA